MSALQLGIVADDLSGAAECAAHALMRVSRSTVVLGLACPSHVRLDPTRAPDRGRPLAVLTVDTDIASARRATEAPSARSARPPALVAAAPVVVKKVDSLLRGNVAAEVAALAEELQRTPVVAVANPALERAVVDGVLHVGGTPLHATDLWAVEPTAAPRTGWPRPCTRWPPCSSRPTRWCAASRPCARALSTRPAAPASSRSATP